MFWRLVDRRLGREVLRGVLRAALQTGKSEPNGLTLAALREALVARGGEGLKALIDQQLDQVVDTDLMIGVPQQRGAQWVSALRNVGSIDVTVTVAGTTDRGEQLLAFFFMDPKTPGDAPFPPPAPLLS